MTYKKNLSFRITAFLFFLLQLSFYSSKAQITWPTGQLLPSFPATAKNQDLIYINGSTATTQRSWKWEAEGPSIGHNTGRLETDGWLCQAGIDAPNQHMVYGPYDNTVTSGNNIAEFRMKIDNNTANNDPVVDIDVRDAATGATLASQTVTRQQFTVASNYTSFKLPFVMPADNHALELRVYWRGGAYIKVDYVAVSQDNSTSEMYLFASLKGIINKTQPRIFSYEGDAFAEGPYTWMQSLGLTWTEHSDNWEVLTKYKSEVAGLIVYDPAQTHTVNLATMLAKSKNAIIASPALLARLTAAPYNFPILMDLRGKFSSKMDVYQTLYNTYWPSLDHRVIIGLDPDAHKAALREYATAIGAAVLWLDPRVAAESTLLNSFLSTMPTGSTTIGWWPDEASGITAASAYGIATVASDWCSNLSVHSGMPRTVNLKPMPPKPTLQNKMYVAFILSDGDNLQYVEHLQRKLWGNPDRGSVPIGWTISPAMLDAMPGALNYLWQSSTDNDNLISGPSGYGYTYPNNWPNQTSLNQFVAKTQDYNNRAGLRVATVWNTIVGGINQNVGQTYATYAPSMLGITAQNTGGGLTIYNNSLPGEALSCNYCTNAQAMKDAIAAAAAGWDRNEPRFIIIQAQPWQDVKPTDFKNVASSLNSDYVVVRPDHIFQLIRESKGLPINPGGNPVNGTGDGLTGSYFNGKNFDTPRVSRKDATVNFDWGTGSPDPTVNVDQFSARWTGQVQPRYTDNYTFYITNDDGGRLWINNQLVIDKWYDDGGTVVSGNITLNAGQKYDIKLEYYENGGGAKAKLEWSSTFQTREVVATAQLYSNPVPSVSITNPTNNSNFNSPANITISVNASDNGSVAKVDYYYGSTLIGSSSAAPFNFAWNSVASGTYTITAIATDNAGAFTISAPVTTTVKVDPLAGNGDGLTGNYFNGMNFDTPVYTTKDATINFDWGNGSPNAAVNADAFSVRWTGQIQPKYSETYTFYLNTDNGRRLWINNQLVVDKWIDDWGIEYSGTIALTAGQLYDIRLEYFEDYGGASCKMEWSSTSQARQVVPQSQLYSNPLPTVSITSPTANASFIAPSNVVINAAAADNKSVIKVEFYNGSMKLGESATAPYSFTINNAAIGSYALTARATDNLGGITVSAAVTIAVKSAVNQPPVVSLTSPAANQSYNAPATISIAANASDPDGSVSKVEFYNGSTLIGTSTSSPYSYTWTAVGAGSYTFSAKAYDNSGAVTTSGSVAVTVVNVVTNKCSGMPTYKENNGYVAGSKVTVAGEIYECKEYPYSGWCNGAAWAYGPGTGSYWTDAWYDRGSCTARVGATEDETSSRVVLSPNPTSGMLTVQVDQSSTVSVYNTLGVLVIPTTSIEATATLDLSALAYGMYLVKIDNGTNVITRSVLKNN